MAREKQEYYYVIENSTISANIIPSLQIWYYLSKYNTALIMQCNTFFANIILFLQIKHCLCKYNTTFLRNIIFLQIFANIILFRQSRAYRVDQSWSALFSTVAHSPILGIWTNFTNSTVSLDYPSLTIRHERVSAYNKKHDSPFMSYGKKLSDKSGRLSFTTHRSCYER